LRLSPPHFRLAEKKEAVPAASLGLYKRCRQTPLVPHAAEEPP